MATEYLNNKEFERIIHRFQKTKRHQARCKLIIEDLKDSINRKTTKQLDASDDEVYLGEQLQECKKIYVDYQSSQDELSNAFYILSKHVAEFAKFHLIDRDEAIQEGAVICYEKIDKFNPKKGKAFNYMTTCILNHFRQMHRTARAFNEFKKRLHEHLQKEFGVQIRPNKAKKDNSNRFSRN